MHGYTHVYDTETNKKDFFNHGGKSEFFGHAYDEQLNRLKKGLKIFNNNQIDIDTFFAPNHTYDENTFDALKEVGILKIIDGYGLLPYEFKNIRFVPQLFYKLIILPYGIQSTQIHVNYWTDKDLIEFENFVEKNHKKIISLDNALSKENNSLTNKFFIFALEKILRFKRIIF